MKDQELQSMITRELSPFTPIFSNELYRKLRGVSKAHYTKVKNEMIEKEWIKAKKRDGKTYLTLIIFRASDYDREDWNKYTMVNCNSALESLNTQRPLFRITKKKEAKIKKDTKIDLGMVFHELDRILIVHSRLVYAQSLGLIPSGRAEVLQDECITKFRQVMKKLLQDHEQFKKEITDFAQSQIKTLQFKI